MFEGHHKLEEKKKHNFSLFKEYISYIKFIKDNVLLPIVFTKLHSLFDVKTASELSHPHTTVRPFRQNYI